MALTYTYDDAGNTKTRSDGAVFDYDHRNRMVQFSQGAVTADYDYLPDNLRYKKSVDGQITWFLYANGQLLAEYDNLGSRTKRYAYLPNSYLATQVEDANGVYEVHGDHLQTPRALTDASKAVVWESVHEGFGKAYISEDVDGDLTAVEFNQGFPGQYRDGESGLVYNWNRYYDSQTGRYVTRDPIGLDGGINIYGYVLQNPITYYDSLGLAVGRSCELDGTCKPCDCTCECIIISNATCLGSLLGGGVAGAALCTVVKQGAFKACVEDRCGGDDEKPPCPQ